MCSDINYIIRMSLKGDKNYQEILLQKLNPLIYKNIYSYWTSSDPISEDLVQEGYALILESLKSFDKNRNIHFLHYIKTKVFYFYKNYYRNYNKINENNLIDNISGEETKDTLDILIDKEEINELLTNIKMLNKKEQKILNLYYYQQLSMKEISEKLNIPYRSVIDKKHIAVKKLNKLMTVRR